jgi:hypothetical protein
MKKNYPTATPTKINEQLTRWAAEQLEIPLRDAPVYALSLRQPWAWAVLNAGKNIENRLWPSFKEGWFFIHASSGCTKREWESGANIIEACSGQTPPALEEMKPTMGGIVGAFKLAAATKKNLALGKNDWAFPDQFHIPILSARPLPFIPCTGAMKFFCANVSPDEAVKPEEPVDESAWPSIEQRIGWFVTTKHAGGMKTVVATHTNGRFIQVQSFLGAPRASWIAATQVDRWIKPEDPAQQ